ncbi:MAG: hypothetical protein LIO86_04530, partial [Lachnospiraceae bacterium]|nr:hypothetical protein [Lachnospiraceae bacterium]
CYTGTLKPSTNVTFDQIGLQEGTYKSGKFTPSSSGVTVAFGSYSTTLSFTGDAYAGESGKLIFSSVTGSKGTLELNGQEVTVNGKVTLLALKDSTGNASLTAADAVTITDVDAKDSLAISTQKAMTLTNIDSGTVTLHTWFSKSKQTQLKINGSIDDSATVTIVPYEYNADTAMTVDYAVANLLVAEDATPVATQKLAVLPMASTQNITIRLNDAADAYDCQLIKYSSGLYMAAADAQLAVRVTGYGTDSTYKTATYQAEFLSWAAAVSEINSIGDKSAYYRIELLCDLGIRDVTDALDDDVDSYYKYLKDEEYSILKLIPLSSLAMPSKAAEVTVTSGLAEGEPAMIFFAPTTLSLGCNTVFENVGLFAVKSSEGWYYGTSYSIKAGNYSLTEKDLVGEVDFGFSKVALLNGNSTLDNRRATLSGSSKGSYLLEQGTPATTGDSYYNQGYYYDTYSTKSTVPLLSSSTKLSGFDTVQLQGDTIGIFSSISGVGTLRLADDTALNLSDSALSVKNLYLEAGSSLEAKSVTITAEGELLADSAISCANGAFSAKTLSMTAASIEAKNVTVSGTTTLNGGRIAAGTETIGDGQIKLANVLIAGADNYLEAKQDKNGNSLLSVTGTVALAESVTAADNEWYGITIGLLYNNRSAFAQLCEGMTLLAAAKAESGWFSPAYDYTYQVDETTISVDRMGVENDSRKLYKSGSQIKYGTSSNMEVALRTLEENGILLAESQYLTFEEAVSAIGSLANTKAYYEIALQDDVEITNTKGAYTTLTLPTKAAKVTVSGKDAYSIQFSGNVTLRCNTEFAGVDLQSMKNGVETTKSIAVGNYTLTANGMGDDISAISGSSSKGVLTVESDLEVSGNVSSLRSLEISGSATLRATGNVNVYQICFLEGDSSACLRTEGTLKATLIYNEYGNGVIQKYADSTMTVKGATLNKVLTTLVNNEADTPLMIELLDEGAAGTAVLTDANLSQTLEGYQVTAGESSTWNIFANGTKLTLRSLETTSADAGNTADAA